MRSRLISFVATANKVCQCYRWTVLFETKDTLFKTITENLIWQICHCSHCNLTPSMLNSNLKLIGTAGLPLVTGQLESILISELQIFRLHTERGRSEVWGKNLFLLVSLHLDNIGVSQFMIYSTSLISLPWSEIPTEANISPVLAAVCSCAWESTAANYSWHVPEDFMPLHLAAMCFLVITFKSKHFRLTF